MPSNEVLLGICLIYMNSHIKYGWVLESDAKQIFSFMGFAIPRFTVAKTVVDALQCANKIHYPVVAKIVSPLTRWSSWT